MSYYDATPPTFPLTLGEAGRLPRRLITIQHAPVLRDGEVLVVVYTDRTWKRRSGKIERFGPTRIIAEGTWAHGDAGNVANGPDMLLAVRPGACWSALGGNGVVWWFWCRPDRSVVRLCRQDRDDDPQGVAPLVRELVNLPDFPVDGYAVKVREWLAAHEAAFGGAPTPLPTILSTSEERARLIGDATRALPLAAAVGAVHDADEAARLTPAEQALLVELTKMDPARRRVLLGELAERVRL
jgi:hypothetical protein